MGDGNARDGLLYFGVEEPKTTPRPATQSEKDRLWSRMNAASPRLKTVVVVVDMQNDYSASSEAPTRCAHWLGTTRAMRVLQCGVRTVRPTASSWHTVCSLPLRSKWATDLDATADRIARFLCDQKQTLRLSRPASCSTGLLLRNLTFACKCFFQALFGRSE